MRTVQALNKTTGERLAAKVKIAGSFFHRAKGLLGRLRLDTDEGMFIPKCRSIHTLFMFFAIDVLFLDKKNRVTKIILNLKPFRIAFGSHGTSGVLELPKFTLKQNHCTIGDEILFINYE